MVKIDIGAEIGRAASLGVTAYLNDIARRTGHAALRGVGNDIAPVKTYITGLERTQLISRITGVVVNNEHTLSDDDLIDGMTLTLGNAVEEPLRQKSVTGMRVKLLGYDNQRVTLGKLGRHIIAAPMDNQNGSFWWSLTDVVLGDLRPGMVFRQQNGIGNFNYFVPEILHRINGESVAIPPDIVVLAPACELTLRYLENVGVGKAPPEEILTREQGLAMVARARSALGNIQPAFKPHFQGVVDQLEDRVNRIPIVIKI